MESSNPSLNPRVFDAARVGVGEPTMTIQGTINKTFILFAVLLAAAIWSWSLLFNPANAGLIKPLFYGGLIIGGILGFVISFNPRLAPSLGFVYAACEGLVLGVFSASYQILQPGIVMEAIGTTLAVALAMLLGYKSGFFQATPALRKGLMIAGGGLCLFYLVVFIASFFGIHPPNFINGGGPLGIAFSMVCAGMASMFLVIDFDNIESAARQGLEKYMEWYGAFALMMTLIWLYIEILRLFSKLQRRN